MPSGGFFFTNSRGIGTEGRSDVKQSEPAGNEIRGAVKVITTLNQTGQQANRKETIRQALAKMAVTKEVKGDAVKIHKKRSEGVGRK